MNKEEIIDESYKNYCKGYCELGYLQDKIFNGNSYYEHGTEEYNFEEYSKEEFIDECKTDNEFSDKWGLKIEERNLNKNQGWERYELLLKRTSEKELQEKYKDDEKAAWLGFRKFTLENANYICDKENVPTKLITIIYNNDTIESYE